MIPLLFLARRGGASWALLTSWGDAALYWIAAVEKFYRKKTTQIERDAARNAPALIVGPAAQRRAAEKRMSALLRNRGRVAELVNTVRGLRDVQWKEALTTQGLEFKIPE